MTLVAHPSRWTIGPISTPTLVWGHVRHTDGRQHACGTCGVVLLTGEDPHSFCCGPGGLHFKDVQPLPPLPPQYDTFINHPRISALSRNLLNICRIWKWVSG
ncbi:hypothetical protein K474DRAFT_1601288 [Panus rudis PR-1116 ss-1]|nr:hypothetical protein K474DRAFT_1601288 [Panus rudis PR-1116 ss-1]